MSIDLFNYADTRWAAYEASAERGPQLRAKCLATMELSGAAGLTADECAALFAALADGAPGEPQKTAKLGAKGV